MWVRAVVSRTPAAALSRKGMTAFRRLPRAKVTEPSREVPLTRVRAMRVLRGSGWGAVRG